MDIGSFAHFIRYHNHFMELEDLQRETVFPPLDLSAIYVGSSGINTGIQIFDTRPIFFFEGAARN